VPLEAAAMHAQARYAVQLQAALSDGELSREIQVDQERVVVAQEPELFVDQALRQVSRREVVNVAQEHGARAFARAG
jgi:hypothetical protein